MRTASVLHALTVVLLLVVPAAGQLSCQLLVKSGELDTNALAFLSLRTNFSYGAFDLVAYKQINTTCGLQFATNNRVIGLSIESLPDRGSGTEMFVVVYNTVTWDVEVTDYFYGEVSFFPEYFMFSPLIPGVTRDSFSAVIGVMEMTFDGPYISVAQATLAADNSVTRNFDTIEHNPPNSYIVNPITIIANCENTTFFQAVPNAAGWKAYIAQINGFNHSLSVPNMNRSTGFEDFFDGWAVRVNNTNSVILITTVVIKTDREGPLYYSYGLNCWMVEDMTAPGQSLVQLNTEGPININVFQNKSEIVRMNSDDGLTWWTLANYQFPSSGTPGVFVTNVNITLGIVTGFTLTTYGPFSLPTGLGSPLQYADFMCSVG